MYKNIVVGLHIGHDRSVCVIADGNLIGFMSEERLDRIKHSSSVQFPLRAMYSLLEYLDIDINNICLFALTYSFVNINSIIDSLSDELKSILDRDDIQVFGVSHHLAHAYSTFYTSGFDDSVIIVADGAGDLTEDEKLESESVYIGGGNGILEVYKRTQDIPSSYSERRTFFSYPYIPQIDRHKQISLARKYEQITYLLDFKWGQSGKTMGLSSYGEKLFCIKKSFNNGLEIDLNMEDLLKEIDSDIKSKQTTYEEYKRVHREDLAKTVQTLTEDIVISFINEIYEKYPCDNLCLGGGLFLNCVLNHKILQKTSFKNIHIIPATGDDGQSIGAAFCVYRAQYKEKINNKKISPFLGLSASDEEISNELRKFSFKFKKLEEDKLIFEIVRLLRQGFICGLIRGRSEMGPRALGHRSILADPALRHTREHINRYVKHREVFRPFAPIVLRDSEFKYFELLNSSPYMLFTAQVRDEYKDKLSAVTHIDGSARVQSISNSDDSFLFKLLLEFEKYSGFPVLLNTSLNMPGEPIAETPKDALTIFSKSNIDFLIMEDYIITKDYCYETLKYGEKR